MERFYSCDSVISVQSRDSKGHFIKGNVPWNKRRDSSPSVPVEVGPEPAKVHGGGVLRPERVRIICPACREEVEAVALDGRVIGYCAVAKRYVDFLVRGANEREVRRKAILQVVLKRVRRVDEEIHSYRSVTKGGEGISSSGGSRDIFTVIQCCLR